MARAFLSTEFIPALAPEPIAMLSVPFVIVCPLEECPAPSAMLRTPDALVLLASTSLEPIAIACVLVALACHPNAVAPLPVASDWVPTAVVLWLDAFDSKPIAVAVALLASAPVPIAKVFVPVACALEPTATALLADAFASFPIAVLGLEAKFDSDCALLPIATLFVLLLSFEVLLSDA